MKVRFYATANVRGPFICMIGRARGGLLQSLRSAVLLHVRDATPDEAQCHRRSLRAATGWRSSTATRMVCEEAVDAGIEAARELCRSLRRHRDQLKVLESRREAKIRRKQRQKARRSL